MLSTKSSGTSLGLSRITRMKNGKAAGVSKRAEQIDQQRIQIHQIAGVILRRKTHDIGKRVLGKIENRVQQPLIHRNVSMSGGFQQLIGRNAFIASRVQNQI